MKLWDKGFTVDKKIENFTIGKDRILDIYIAKHDMLASKAQANMLAKVGLLSDEENEQLQKALDQLLVDLENGNFEIDEHFEDVHSKIESELIKLTGDAGKKIHVARSRNDQVLVALQLFQKEYLEDVTDKVLELVNIMLKKAEEHKNDLLPGYTHFQAAMPNSFGMWFTAYAENLLSDLVESDLDSFDLTL